MFIFHQFNSIIIRFIMTFPRFTHSKWISAIFLILILTKLDSFLNLILNYFLLFLHIAKLNTHSSSLITMNVPLFVIKHVAIHLFMNLFHCKVIANLITQYSYQSALFLLILHSKIITILILSTLFL